MLHKEFPVDMNLLNRMLVVPEGPRFQEYPS